MHTVDNQFAWFKNQKQRNTTSKEVATLSPMKYENKAQNMIWFEPTQ